MPGVGRYKNLDEEVDQEQATMSGFSKTNLLFSGQGGYQSFPGDRSMQESGLAEPLRGDLFSTGPPVPTAPETHNVFLPDGAGPRSRWDHQKNLDEFFTRIYDYHQKGGFFCILLSETMELLQFLFIVTLSTFLLQCVDYGVLFADKSPEESIPATTITTTAVTPTTTTINGANTTTPFPTTTTPSSGGRENTFRHKLTLADALHSNCAARISGWLWICLIIAAIFWAWRFVKVGYQLLHYWEIRSFYLSALKISSADLDNMTWHEILQRLCQVQETEELAIQSQELTELDIYQRILRRKNYVVALVNKGIFPPRFQLPFLGTVVFFPLGFKHNVEFLLFWGSWAPWKDYFTLRPEYKRRDSLADVTRELERVTLWMGIGNLLLSPLIMVWQILYSAFSYAELIKREPGALGMRRWSAYGKYFFRHFNEMDHELKMRLSRAYRPATQYQELFVSKISEIIAKNIALIAGAFFSVLAVLSVWDEDVLQVEHVLTVMTVCGFIVFACKLFIQDENLVWCPELLMRNILAHVHYLPDSWRGHAHADRVRTEFTHFFQFKVFFLIEELLSPLITPFVILFWLRPRVAEFVQFFHRFTVEVEGLGDVCSFAQMDVAAHGDKLWQTAKTVDSSAARPTEIRFSPHRQSPDKDAQASNGKTEMSIVHFAVTNPNWNPPPSSARFLARLKQQTTKDADVLREHHTAIVDNPLLHSMNSMGLGPNMGGLPATMVMPPGSGVQFSRLGTISRLQGVQPSPSTLGPGLLTNSGSGRLQGRRVSKTEGPLLPPQEGLLASLHLSGVFHQSATDGVLASSGSRDVGMGISQSPMAMGQPRLGEGTAMEMSLQSLYLHELHHMRIRGRNYGATTISPATSGNSPSDKGGGHGTSRNTSGPTPQTSSSSTNQNGSPTPSPQVLWRVPSDEDIRGRHHRRNTAIQEAEEATPDDAASTLFESA